MRRYDPIVLLFSFQPSPLYFKSYANI